MTSVATLLQRCSSRSRRGDLASRRWRRSSAPSHRGSRRERPVDRARWRGPRSTGSRRTGGAVRSSRQNAAAASAATPGSAPSASEILDRISIIRRALVRHHGGAARPPAPGSVRSCATGSTRIARPTSPAAGKEQFPRSRQSARAALRSCSTAWWGSAPVRCRLARRLDSAVDRRHHRWRAGGARGSGSWQYGRRGAAGGSNGLPLAVTLSSRSPTAPDAAGHRQRSRCRWPREAIVRNAARALDNRSGLALLSATVGGAAHAHRRRDDRHHPGTHLARNSGDAISASLLTLRRGRR